MAAPRVGQPVALQTPVSHRLGLRVVRLRRLRNWGQADLAAISGLERSYISKIENGRLEIGLTTLEVLAATFEMSISQFMRGV